MDFIDQKIENYCNKHSKIPSDILQNLDRQTHVKMLRPRMLSGALQGNLLRMIVQMIQPNLILEIGTFTGYSAIAMAEGMKENAHLHTIDCNPEIEEFAHEFITKAGFENKITVHIGDALEIIPTLKFNFDLAFIDADKENYLNYFNAIYPLLNKGGFILVDNVLWSGKVIEELNEKDVETLAIKEFNETVAEDKNVEVLMLPIRDGLSLIRKK